MQNVNYLPLKDSGKFIELLIDIKYKTPAFEEKFIWILIHK